MITAPIPYVEVVDPTDKFRYRYATINESCTWRANTLFVKEPDTINWISQMSAGELLLDIGANIGVYTIFAAVRGIMVVAFEPEAQNYAALCKNIFINELDVLAYCIALTDHDAINTLYLKDFYAGSSGHSYAENLDHNLHRRQRTVKQGTIGMRLDSWGISAHYIKIDVDGLEHKVVAGGLDTIKNCKSILVEVNNQLQEHLEMVDTLTKIGFKYDQRQVEQSMRKEGTFAGCSNYIFYR